MTTPDLPTESAEAVPGAAESVPESESGKGLRSQLEATQAELKEMKDRALDDAFSRNGLSRSNGIGKAFAKDYEGEPTQQAVAEFLQAEYQFEVEPEAHPFALQIARGQAELDQLQQTGGSVSLPSQTDQLAAAEARGDYATAFQIKSHQLGQLLDRR